MHSRPRHRAGPGSECIMPVSADPHVTIERLQAAREIAQACRFQIIWGYLNIVTWLGDLAWRDGDHDDALAGIVDNLEHIDELVAKAEERLTPEVRDVIRLANVENLQFIHAHGLAFSTWHDAAKRLVEILGNVFELNKVSKWPGWPATDITRHAQLMFDELRKSRLPDDIGEAEAKIDLEHARAVTYISRSIEAETRSSDASSKELGDTEPADALDLGEDHIMILQHLARSRIFQQNQQIATAIERHRNTVSPLCREMHGKGLLKRPTDRGQGWELTTLGRRVAEMHSGSA
jgi:hypothetical protein